jgi:tyrosyl-tRNA synthetase
MTLSEELTWRGFINQTTFKDLAALDKTKMTFYHGFDASADSQTIGNLAAMMFDKVFIRHGYKAILLAGGATSLIGDPGGKDAERPMQSEEAIRHNVAMAEKQLKQIFSEDSFTLVNNLDWIQPMSVIEFLRDVGKNFGMSTLVQRDYIQKRIGEGGTGMSYSEFSYTLLQGYDFLHLYREHGCTLQLAGSDQWGNSLSGVDLIRKAEGAETHVLTLPLIINKSTGKKFGKSEDGAVWLDSEKTSAYKFYQFWLNADDEGVGDYLKIYTLIEKDEFDALMAEFKKNPSERAAQKQLAYEVTQLVHGAEQAESARNVTAVLFGDTPVEQLLKEDLAMLSQEIPTTTSGNVINALVTSGVTKSNGEARRLIEGGAISINGEKITEDSSLKAPSLIKKGKNTFILAA